MPLNSDSQPSHHNPGMDLENDPWVSESDLLPKKKELHQTFIQTLQNVLPHLGKDESKIVSALIILALKLEGLIGKEISNDDSKLIEILKNMIMTNESRKESALEMANRLTKSAPTPPKKSPPKN